MVSKWLRKKKYGSEGYYAEVANPDAIYTAERCRGIFRTVAEAKKAAKLKANRDDWPMYAVFDVASDDIVFEDARRFV